MDRSAVVTPMGAWCRSHVATRRRSGATPTQAPRRSRGSECQRVVLWWGSRRRSRRGLPVRMALLVAFPSHLNGRSPIAWGSPPDRRCGRFSGGRAANLDAVVDSWPDRCAPNLTIPFGTLFFSRMEVLRDTLLRDSPIEHFLKSRRASARNPGFVLQIVFVDSFVGRPAGAGFSALPSHLCRVKAGVNVRQMPILRPANADTRAHIASGKCR